MKATTAILFIILLAVQCPAGAQAPSGKTAGDKTAPPPPGGAMDSFLGFPFKSFPLSAVEFNDVIPAPYLKLRLNMTKTDAEKVLPPKFGPKGQELRYEEQFYFSHEQIQYHNLPGKGVQGPSILTDIVFDTYHNPPPTRDRIRKLAGLLYRALGHPSGIYESPQRRGLSLLWVKGPSHVSLETDFFQNGPPRTILRVINLKVRDYPFEFPTSKDWVEVRIQNNPTAFKTKILSINSDSSPPAGQGRRQ